MVLKEEVMKALENALDPETGMSVVEMGMIKDVVVNGNDVLVKIVLTTPFCPMVGAIIAEVKSAALAAPGVKNVGVEIVGYGIGGGTDA